MSSKVDFSKIDLSDPADWLPMQELSDEYKQFTLPTIRYFFTRRVEKGLDPIIKKFGKQLLCNRKGFGHWMANV